LDPGSETLLKNRGCEECEEWMGTSPKAKFFGFYFSDVFRKLSHALFKV
jgi:hypothetical protein